RVRNTSSRVALCTAKRRTVVRPGSTSSRMARTCAAAPSVAAPTVRLPGSLVTTRPPRQRTTSSNAAASASVRSRRCAATCALSSCGVPSATTRPPSSTAMRLASWSASSRYWVVRNTVTPDPARSAMTAHIVCRLRRSSPVVGSSRKITEGRPTRPAALPAGQAGQPSHHAQVLLTGLQLIHRRVLPGEGDAAADQMPVADHIETRHPGLAGVRPGERGQDPHHRGLACSVGSEQREHAAAGHPQADAGQNAHGAVRLLQVDRLDRQVVGHFCQTPHQGRMRPPLLRMAYALLRRLYAVLGWLSTWFPPAASGDDG